MIKSGACKQVRHFALFRKLNTISLIPRVATDQSYPPGSEDSKGRLVHRVHEGSFSR